MNSALATSPGPLVTHKPSATAEISRPVASLLVVLALLSIGVPTVIETFRRAVTVTPVTTQSPTIPDLLAETLTSFWNAEGAGLSRLQSFSDQWDRSVRQLERSLEETALLNPRSLAAVRGLLVSMGLQSLGNVDIGSRNPSHGSRHLFFRPDIVHLTGPGFLAPEMLTRRTGDPSAPAAGTEQVEQPDPRLAILDFAKQLKLRGIKLIVMPTPSKAAFANSWGSGSTRTNTVGNSDVLRNASFGQFVDELRAAGVTVFDVADSLQQLGNQRPDQALYLQTDTHWTPLAVQAVARQLAVLIRERQSLPVSPQQRLWQRNPQTQVINKGDLAELLQLPDFAGWNRPEETSVQQVRCTPSAGQAASSVAPVLLLGDSFTNIYDSEELGWGTDAGLADQLACELQVGVQSIAVNGGGASAARQRLFRDLASGQLSLAHSRVVVWQFAERELSEGDWPLLKIPDERVPTSPANAERSNEQWLSLRGRVRAATTVSAPRQLPYPDAIICVHVEQVTTSGTSVPGNEALVYTWGVRNREVVSGSFFQPGQTVHLRVRAWDQVRTRYERFQRIELDDPEFRLVDLPIFWLESP